MRLGTAAHERTWSIAVPHHALGARIARQRLASELSGVLPIQLLLDAVAVVSELVGNAVSHADPLPGGDILVCWHVGVAEALGPAYVEIRVTDGGAAQVPHALSVGPESVTGRGLAIVAALARRWGVEQDGAGQCVWAELGA
jgi:anti-sigma regulatory factor (Ser/Thr protein kinase)